jgi:hypothetical protein
MGMNNRVREVKVRNVLPLEGSFAVFLGDETKTFVIYVDESVGTAISMFMRGIATERPMTHELLASVLLAFGAKVDRVVINDVAGAVFYARLILVAENQLAARKVVELDARPSDSIALAVQQGAPIFVADKVWSTVEDVSSTLEQIEARAASEASAAGSAEEEDDDEFEDDEDEIFEDDDDDDLDDDEDEEDDEEDHRPGSSTY